MAETTLSFVTQDEEAYNQAENYFTHLERIDFKPLSAAQDPSEALKKLVEHAMKYGKAKAPLMISEHWKRGADHLVGVGVHDGQHTHIFYGRGENLTQAREDAYKAASEHLVKTPLSYHSHLHGAVAEEKAQEEETDEEPAE